jgi:hypothetical protein
MKEFSLFPMRVADLQGPHLVNTPAENLASEFYKRIVQIISDFDAELDHTKEVGIRLVAFGQALTFQITGLGYSDPSLIIFAGNRLDDGSYVKLVQHVSQISFLLTAVPRSNPALPKKQIGFLRYTE